MRVSPSSSDLKENIWLCSGRWSSAWHPELFIEIAFYESLTVFVTLLCQIIPVVVTLKSMLNENSLNGCWWFVKLTIFYSAPCIFLLHHSLCNPEFFFAPKPYLKSNYLAEDNTFLTCGNTSINSTLRRSPAVPVYGLRQKSIDDRFRALPLLLLVYVIFPCRHTLIVFEQWRWSQSGKESSDGQLP